MSEISEAEARRICRFYDSLSPDRQLYVRRRGHHRAYFGRDDEGTKNVLWLHSPDGVRYADTSQFPWPIRPAQRRSYVQVGDVIGSRSLRRFELLGYYPELRRLELGERSPSLIQLVDIFLLGNVPTHPPTYVTAEKIKEIGIQPEGRGFMITRPFVMLPQGGQKRVVVIDITRLYMWDRLEYSIIPWDERAGVALAVANALETYGAGLYQVLSLVETGWGEVLSHGVRGILVGSGRRLAPRLLRTFLRVYRNRAARVIASTGAAFVRALVEKVLHQLAEMPESRRSWNRIDWQTALTAAATEAIGELGTHLTESFGEWCQREAGSAIAGVDATEALQAVMGQTNLLAAWTAKFLEHFAMAPAIQLLQAAVEALGAPTGSPQSYEGRLYDALAAKVPQIFRVRSADQVGEAIIEMIFPGAALAAAEAVTGS